MSFDTLGSELLQQPLLSAQIIPEMADNELLINKMVKPAMVMEKTVKITQPNTHKVIQQNATTIQTKSTTVERNIQTQKVQYVKRIPTNVVQVSDPKPALKQQNNASFNENVVTNTPIVINKVNGNNISGMYRFRVEIDLNLEYVDQTNFVIDNVIAFVCNVLFFM